MIRRNADEEIAALFKELDDDATLLKHMLGSVRDEELTPERFAQQKLLIEELAGEVGFTLERFKESLLRHGLLDESRLHPSTGRKVPNDTPDDEIPF